MPMYSKKAFQQKNTSGRKSGVRFINTKNLGSPPIADYSVHGRDQMISKTSKEDFIRLFQEAQNHPSLEEVRDFFLNKETLTEEKVKTLTAHFNSCQRCKPQIEQIKKAPEAWLK